MTLLFTIALILGLTITGTDTLIIFILEAIMFIAIMVWIKRLNKRQLRENEAFKVKATAALVKSQEIPDYMKRSFMPMNVWISDGKIHAMGKNKRYYELGKKYKTSGDGIYRTLKDCFNGNNGFQPNSDETVVCEVSVTAFDSAGSISRNQAGEVVSCMATEFEILSIVPLSDVEKAGISVTNNHYIAPERKQSRLETSSIKGYKAFSRRESEWDGILNCKGRPFKVGETQTVPGRIVVCKNGIHFCLTVTDCFSYYGNVPSTIICEVEASGHIVKDEERESMRIARGDNDTKYCARTIKVVKELSRDEINELLESETPVAKSKTPESKEA